MYELNISTFGQHTRYSFHHPTSNNGFSLVPAAGANLLDLFFNGNHLLDGYQTPEELDAGKWGKSALLCPFPNRLDAGKYTWMGKSYQFPLNSEATGNAIHGFVRGQVFEPTYIFLSAHMARIGCVYHYPGDLAYYPFPFSMEVIFAIHNSGKFELHVSIQNLHDTAIPMGFGWHPYFKLAAHADVHQMKLPASEKIIVNERMIPTGQREKMADFQKLTPINKQALDTCFAYKNSQGRYRIILKNEGKTLQINAQAATFPFFQVFTPPHRESIALEPMSCNVDAFNNQADGCSLAPGETWKGVVRMAYKNTSA